jgi:outer membrane assembly lipoprotein YfiO
MNRTISICMALALLCTVSGVSAKRKAKLYECDKRIDKAMARYERGWYSDVITTLQEVQFQCGGHGRMDSVTYYLGMALMKDNRPEEARGQFRRVVDNFSGSAFALEARFRQGQCSFEASSSYDRDQSDTRDAIQELSDFVQDAPQSAWADSARQYLDKCYDKLARKEYESARFYFRIDKFDAAIVYFKALIDEYPSSKYVPEAHLQLAQSLTNVNRATEAEALLREVVDGDYGDDVKRRAKLQLGRIEQSK